MSGKVSIQYVDGKRIWGHYVVRDGVVTSLHPMAEKQGEGLKVACSPRRPSQKRFLLQQHPKRHTD